MCFEYSEVVRDGVRTLIRMLTDGASRDALIALPLSPYKKTNSRMRRLPNIFSFSAKDGLWKGRILPELNEQLETSRIIGSSPLRQEQAGHEDPKPDGKEPKKGKKKKTKLRTVTGGQNVDPPTRTVTGDKAKDTVSYPSGETIERSGIRGIQKTCPKRCRDR